MAESRGLVHNLKDLQMSYPYLVQACSYDEWCINGVLILVFKLAIHVTYIDRHNTFQRQKSK